MVEQIREFIERGVTRVIVGQANKSPDIPIGEIEELYKSCGVTTVYDVDRNTITFEVEGMEDEYRQHENVL